MEPNILKRKQEILLDILKEVVKICEKHNIRYFAISGTLIGAVRHRGFIPWDDDIDIAMPRKDWNRFIKIAPGELPEHLSLLDPAVIRHFRVPFIKVQDRRTTCVASYELRFPDSYAGISVDIMPLDGFPAPGLGRKFALTVLEALRAFNLHKRFLFIRDEMKTWPKVRKVFNTLYRPFRFLFPFAFYYKVFNLILRAFPFDKSEYVYFPWLPNQYMRIFDKKFFESFVYLDFEDMKIRAPADYDGYLTGDYGDYMTPPPEKARAPHQTVGGILDMERSYTYYTEERGSANRT